MCDIFTSYEYTLEQNMLNNYAARDLAAAHTWFDWFIVDNINIFLLFYLCTLRKHWSDTTQKQNIT